jgi:Domain of unknown function (DUF222)/HNH endonuclease
VSELLSAIEGFRAETLAELPDARLEEDLAELQRAGEALELERLRRLAEIDRRGLYERDGHLSAASWLASSHRIAWGAAREQVRLARTLEEMPLTRRAWEEGQISRAAVRLISEARSADPEAFARTEVHLVEAARRHSIAELGRVLAFWRERVERDREPEGPERLHAHRNLHASVTFGGMVRVDGDLDPETGESLLTALRAVLDTDARSGDRQDTRTPAQRRADALGEICRQWLDGSARPVVAGERPHLTLSVDVEALSASSGRTAVLDHAGPVRPDVARRLACDAGVMRVVMRGRSEPLDVGRRTPVVPPAVRRAVIVRDRTCRFPGCERPHTWCDAHHVRHWADGGPTALRNLVLLCRRHHRMVHAPGGFGLRIEEGTPVFRRPDGSVLEDRAPP